VNDGKRNLIASINPSGSEHDSPKQKSSYAINLQNPKQGDYFRFFKDEIWQVERYIPYHGNVAYNRGLLIIRKPKGQRLFTVPHRINGNLERYTLHELFPEHVPYLRNPLPSWNNIPFDIQAIFAYSNLQNLASLYPSRDDKGTYYSITSRPLKRSEVSEDKLTQYLTWAIQAVHRGGGIFMNTPSAYSTLMPVDGKHLFQSERFETIYQVFVQFRIELLLAKPKADVNLIDNLPPKPTEATIFPDNIEKTAQVLLKHFDIDELIDMLEHLKKDEERNL
jgi:hypothetical protein